LTYKQSPDRIAAPCEITHVYGREEAFEVIRRSHEDYRDHFGSLTGLLASSPSMTRAATSAPKRATAAASGARPRGRRPRRSSGRGTSR